MADIQFRVDAVLGDTTQLMQQIQNLQTNLTLNINNTQALQAVQQVQQRIDALRQSAGSVNLNVGGAGNIFNANGLSNGVNSAQQMQQAMQGVGLQMDRIRTVNGQWESITERIGDRYTTIESTLRANNTLTETTTNNYKRLQGDIDDFNRKNLNAIDFEIQKREMASQRFSTQLKSQMEAQAKLDSLGTDTGSTLNTANIRDIDSLQAALAKSNVAWDNNTSSVRGFSQQVDDAGNTITKFTVRQEKLGADGKQYWQDTSYAVSDVDNKVRQLGQHQTEMNKANTQSLVQQIKMQFKQYAIYYAVSTVIQTIAQTFSDCINYVEDLDEAMTNIRVVTMDSKEAAEDLLDTYNQIGQSLGASTVDVAEGAVDWLRQGYSTEDTNTLVTDSTILSKLALIDTAEATEYLTSALKGYKLEASDAIGVIDQLVSIDLKAATSAGDMAEAMSRTANMAKTTGFEMNELLGVIATMSEVTQNSAGVVGNSVSIK